MFAIHHCNFWIGTKIPFSQFPHIVQSFLQQQELGYKRFLYYFEGDDTLHRIQKDCPAVGPIRTRTNGKINYNFISNIDMDTDCTQSEILALVPKIHKQYGFSDNHLIYQDVNFFSKSFPAFILEPGCTPHSIIGPCIRCCRDGVFPRWSGIQMQFVTFDGQQIYDPTPYIEAMKQLLPGIVYKEFTEFFLPPQEQAMYENLNQQAEPVLEQIRAYFQAQLPASVSPGYKVPVTPKLSAAPVLKKLCKQFGYSYINCQNGLYTIQKRTANGHYIIPEIDIGPNFKAVSCWIHFKGAAFDHRIGATYRVPHCQAELEQDLLQLFRTLSGFEEKYLSRLDAHFPPTPDWFIPR